MNRASFQALGISNGLLQVSNIRHLHSPSEFQLRWLVCFVLFWSLFWFWFFFGWGDDEQCKDGGLGDPGRYFFSSYTCIIYLSQTFFWVPTLKNAMLWPWTWCPIFYCSVLYIFWQKGMENTQYNLKNHHIPAMKKTWNIVDNPIFYFSII